MTYINICGIPHEIIEQEDFFGSDLHLGEIDYGKATITINKDVSEVMKEETLCHEIVHGMLMHIGRNDLTNDEVLVQALGNAINQSFKIVVYSDDKNNDDPLEDDGK